MGVTPYGGYLSAKGKQCFFCSETIEADPAVCWIGGEATIFLHEGCAMLWGAHLGKDSLNASYERARINRETKTVEEATDAR